MRLTQHSWPSSSLLRIAHVSPAYFAEDSLIGGGERYVSYVARALREAAPSLPFSISQAVFAMGRKDHSYSDGGVPVTVFSNENPGSHPMAVMSARLWDVLAEFDLIHLHQGLTFFGCYIATIARSLGKTLIVTDLGGGENPLLLQHGGLGLADGMLSISEFAKSLVSAYFAGPHAVVVGPVDTMVFTAPKVLARPRSVISVGRLLPHKGADRIIDALPPNLPLRLVGRPYDPAYYELLHERAAGKDVTFIVDADDAALLRCYHEAGLYVHASTFVDVYGRRISKPELMGLTTLEAMATGLPVAVAKTASLPELAHDLRFCRVFPDVAALRAILEDFAAGVWPEPAAADLPRRHVVDNFSFPVVGRRIAEFYAEVHAVRLMRAHRAQFRSTNVTP
ncbi:MAG: glycosyltransferase family 4 protein [Alphaproteobacteria bacterium]|nr:glycosyltransferase family 4 protein [Alphaproteobacteria bacterium]